MPRWTTLPDPRQSSGVSVEEIRNKVIDEIPCEPIARAKPSRDSKALEGVSDWTCDNIEPELLAEPSHTNAKRTDTRGVAWGYAEHNPLRANSLHESLNEPHKHRGAITRPSRKIRRTDDMVAVSVEGGVPGISGVNHKSEHSRRTRPKRFLRRHEESPCPA